MFNSGELASSFYILVSDCLVKIVLEVSCFATCGICASSKRYKLVIVVSFNVKIVVSYYKFENKGGRRNNWFNLVVVLFSVLCSHDSLEEEVNILVLSHEEYELSRVFSVESYLFFKSSILKVSFVV